MDFKIISDKIKTEIGIDIGGLSIYELQELSKEHALIKEYCDMYKSFFDEITLGNKKASQSRYFLELFKQFKQAMGINSQEKLENHESEFIDWLSSQQTAKCSYAQLLTNMDVRSGLIAELGKGYYDSIVPNLDGLYVEAVAITPFTETFRSPNFTVLNGEIIFSNGNPTIKYNDGNNMLAYPNCNELINKDISTLITQLPYNNVDLNALVESSKQYNDVAIGSYGNTNDKDANDKVQLLRQIKDVIENQYCVDCKEELATQNGTYNHIILSHQKRLILEKTLTRTK